VSDGTPLGALLIEEGLLTDAQLDAALIEQAKSGKPLGRLLIEQGTISEAELVRTLARQVGLEFVDLGEYPIDASVASLVSESVARRYQAIPIGWEDGKLIVAMADPSNVFAVDDIRAIAGAEVHTVVATASQIIETIERFSESTAKSTRSWLRRRRTPTTARPICSRCRKSSRTRRSSSSSTCW
jgi:type IV pilus assembly protein PilB